MRLLWHKVTLRKTHYFCSTWHDAVLWISFDRYKFRTLDKNTMDSEEEARQYYLNFKTGRFYSREFSLNMWRCFGCLGLSLDVSGHSVFLVCATLKNTNYIYYHWKLTPWLNEIVTPRDKYYAGLFYSILHFIFGLVGIWLFVLFGYRKKINTDHEYENGMAVEIEF